jgi:hypothetical protein
VTQTATVKPVPIITHVSTSGAAIQTVNQNAAISAISYTATASATFTKTGSTFPSGLNVSASGSSYSISGTPSATGTFGYSLTASANGCASAAAVGTITVNAMTAPPGAASTQTWVWGSQTWSDRIAVAPSSCTKKTTLTIGEIYYNPSAEYIVLSGNYYYNRRCFEQAGSSELCPSPWRVPTYSDVNALSDIFRGGKLSFPWPTPGRVEGATLVDVDTGFAHLVDKVNYEGYYMYWTSPLIMGSGPQSNRTTYNMFGLQIRCIK